ncbi:hypothetical protein H6H01_05665 [Nostoc calcicola FACHB-3891]|nr:hypothetical protein [Nostoc calcicola FACHB-3891]
MNIADAQKNFLLTALLEVFTSFSTSCSNVKSRPSLVIASAQRLSEVSEDEQEKLCNHRRQ